MHCRSFPTTALLGVGLWYKSAMRWLLLIALLVASNVATFYVTKKNARPKGHSVESVLAEVRTATGIVMMGDSLVEDAKFLQPFAGFGSLMLALAELNPPLFSRLPKRCIASRRSSLFLLV